MQLGLSGGSGPQFGVGVREGLAGWLPSGSGGCAAEDHVSRSRLKEALTDAIGGVAIEDRTFATW